MAGSAAPRSPRILGLTGAIACGKTTVGDILLRLGALERIDADRVVHELMVPGTPVTDAIAERFGRDVLAPSGAVDRPRLGAIVFNDPAGLRDLESITHPAVRQEIRRRLDAADGRDGVVVIDAVKLLQSDLLPLCDEVWVVHCAPNDQMRRLTDLRGMSTDAAGARLAAQPSFDHRAVTRVIENTGSMEDLQRQVEGAWKQLTVCQPPSQGDLPS